MARYERHYDAWLEKELGDLLRTARAASGGRARLECSGNMFVRALCKLTHRGYSQYVKGGGDAFADFLAECYPGVTNNCLSRAEYSNRQDWSLEVSWELFPLPRLRGQNATRRRKRASGLSIDSNGVHPF